MRRASIFIGMTALRVATPAICVAGWLAGVVFDHVAATEVEERRP